MKKQADWTSGTLAYKRPKYLNLTVRLNNIFDKFYVQDEPELPLLKKMAHLLNK